MTFNFEIIGDGYSRKAATYFWGERITRSLNQDIAEKKMQEKMQQK